MIIACLTHADAVTLNFFLRWQTHVVVIEKLLPFAEWSKFWYIESECNNYEE